MFWIFSHVALTFFKPMAAELPFRKCPSLDSSERSLFFLQRIVWNLGEVSYIYVCTGLRTAQHPYPWTSPQLVQSSWAQCCTRTRDRLPRPCLAADRTCSCRWVPRDLPFSAAFLPSFSRHRHRWQKRSPLTGRLCQQRVCNREKKSIYVIVYLLLWLAGFLFLASSRFCDFGRHCDESGKKRKRERVGTLKQGFDDQVRQARAHFVLSALSSHTAHPRPQLLTGCDHTLSFSRHNLTKFERIWLSLSSLQATMLLFMWGILTQERLGTHVLTQPKNM